MRKLNQVLETSIKSSYRTRYEYNLNDYKKNFQTESPKKPNYLDENYYSEKEIENNKNKNKNILEDYDYNNDDEENNVISSKRFFAEKNANLAKRPSTAAKVSLADKSDNYQNTLIIKNKQNGFAQFEEVERISPKKTTLKNNIVKTKAEFQQHPTPEDKIDYSFPYENDNSQYSKAVSINNNTNKNEVFNQNYSTTYGNTFSSSNVISNSSELNRKTNLPSNNFAQLNYQFESFNLDNVLKTADDLSKYNKGGVEINNKRVEIANKVYDIQKLKKIQVPNVNKKNNLKNNDNFMQSNLYSTTDKNLYENDNFNSYSETNFTNNNNNVKTEDDEFDYLKNLLMKTQMEIQNFNNEFDYAGDSNDFNRNRTGGSLYYTNNRQENIYVPDSTKDFIPRKQPKPTKPNI